MEAIKQWVKYVGEKPSIVVQFPVPFISKSDAEGDPITFKRNTPVALSPVQADQLCKQSGVVYKMCDEQGKAPKA